MKSPTMSAASSRRAVVALLVMMTCASLAGCSTTSHRIDKAGAAIGQAAAGIQLEPWPERCRTTVPHASLKAGEEVVSILKRERGQLNLANSRIRDCAAYYEEYRQGLAGNGR